MPLTMMNGARMRCTDSTVGVTDCLTDNPVTDSGKLYDPSEVHAATLSFRVTKVIMYSGATIAKYVRIMEHLIHWPAALQASNIPGSFTRTQ